MPNPTSDSTPVTPVVIAPAIPETPKAVETPLKASAEGLKIDPKAPSAAEIKRWKLISDGVEEEVDENELIVRAQKGKAADKRMAEAAAQRKKLETVMGTLKEAPMGFLEELLGAKQARELVEGHLYEKIQDETLTPEQRKTKEELSELERLRAEKAEYEKAAQDEKIKVLEAHYEQEYARDIPAALTQVGLPTSPATVKKVAYYMWQGLERGVELKAADVVNLVKEDYMSDVRSLFGASDGESLLQMLGEDVAGKIRKADLARMKKEQSPVGTPTKGTSAERPKKKFMTMQEWKDEIAKQRDE